MFVVVDLATCGSIGVFSVNPSYVVLLHNVAVFYSGFAFWVRYQDKTWPPPPLTSHFPYLFHI